MALTALSALAQYPGKPIRLLAPFPAAGAADLAARAIVQRYAFDARSSSPEELGTYLKEQVDLWIRTARDVGIVPD